MARPPPSPRPAAQGSRLAARPAAAGRAFPRRAGPSRPPHRLRSLRVSPPRARAREPPRRGAPPRRRRRARSAWLGWPRRPRARSDRESSPRLILSAAVGFVAHGDRARRRYARARDAGRRLSARSHRLDAARRAEANGPARVRSPVREARGPEPDGLDQGPDRAGDDRRRRSLRRARTGTATARADERQHGNLARARREAARLSAHLRHARERHGGAPSPAPALRRRDRRLPVRGRLERGGQARARAVGARRVVLHAVPVRERGQPARALRRHRRRDRGRARPRRRARRRSRDRRDAHGRRASGSARRSRTSSSLPPSHSPAIR